MSVDRETILEQIERDAAARLELHGDGVAAVLAGSTDEELDAIISRSLSLEKRIKLRVVALAFCDAVGDEKVGPVEGPGWETVKFVAFTYGFSEQHVRKLLAKGEIRGVLRDGVWRIWLRSVAEYADRRRKRDGAHSAHESQQLV